MLFSVCTVKQITLIKSILVLKEFLFYRTKISAKKYFSFKTIL